MSMYVADHNERLPYPNYWIPGTNHPGWLYTHDSVGAPPNLWAWPYTNDPAMAYKTGLYFDYVRQPKVYVCPLDAGSKYFARRPNKLSTYKMNDAVAGFPLSILYRSCKITEVWSPLCWLMWEEDENLGDPAIGHVAYLDGASWPDPQFRHPDAAVGYHHGPGAIVQAVDGHVFLLTYKQFRIEQQNPNKGLIWWSPWTTNGQ
jgi:hypothetical protein